MLRDNSLLLIVLCATLQGALCAPRIREDNLKPTCLTKNDYPYTFFGTKTTYLHPDIGNENTDPIRLPGLFQVASAPKVNVNCGNHTSLTCAECKYGKSGCVGGDCQWNENGMKCDKKDCEPKSFWLVARHGFRNPGKDDIIKMKMRGPKIRDAILQNNPNNSFICKEDLDLLKGWSFKVDENQKALLVPTGERELKGIGERFSKRLPSLLGNGYTKDKFKFVHTSKERTLQSARAFVEGMFSVNRSTEIVSDFQSPDDDLLRSYKRCQRYQSRDEDFEEGGEETEEQKSFRESYHVQSMITRVNKRLGFDGNVTNSQNISKLSFDDILLIAKICAFQNGYNPEITSPFCVPFDEEDLKVIEYYKDLEKYELDGPGQDLNMKIACPLIRDLKSSFDRVLSIKNGTFYFSHSTTLMLLMNILGATKDDITLTADLYGKYEGTQRNFRSSVLTPMAANVAFVLFECKEGNRTRKRIVGYLNERPIFFKRCNNSFSCDWKTFKSIFKEALNCPFEELCSLDENNKERTEKDDYDSLKQDEDDEEENRDDDMDENDDSDNDDEEEEEDEDDE